MQERATATVTGTERPPTEWQCVDWRKANKVVSNLRQRIFRATQQGDWAKVRSLQKLMLRSYSNTLVSVRKVTQENTGKRTPGVDKVVVKTPSLRGRLVDLLMTNQPWKARPARRIYIAKANGKQRGLGIPTIVDRCLQARVKNALEPSWEARFEGSSYGFRPGRGCHDAIERIYLLACPHKTKKWVVDADIKGAFDHISHTYLLDTIGSVPGRELIRQWLKAGYVDKDVFFDTEEGTPQGGVISPLLANIALHGMEEALGVKYDSSGNLRSKRAVVKYADDFVVFCESKDDAEKVTGELTHWLAQRGLTLSPEKTKIVHLTEGFDFLSYNVRHYKRTRTRTGWKLLIQPSKDAVKKVRRKLKEKWLSLKATPVAVTCTQLNPIIRGWANYHRVKVATRTFQAMDRWMFYRAARWAKFRHHGKSTAWRSHRYWGRLNPERQDTWVFGDKRTGVYLLKFAWFTRRHHILVKGKASPDDPALRDYWHQRRTAKAYDLNAKDRRLATRQGHVCAICHDSLMNGEVLQIQHILPREDPRRNDETYQRLAHLLCQQQLTTVQRQRTRAGCQPVPACEETDRTGLSVGA